jgi:hypothetical protein
MLHPPAAGCGATAPQKGVQGAKPPQNNPLPSGDKQTASEERARLVAYALAGGQGEGQFTVRPP